MDGCWCVIETTWHIAQSKLSRNFFDTCYLCFSCAIKEHYKGFHQNTTNRGPKGGVQALLRVIRSGDVVGTNSCIVASPLRARAASTAHGAFRFPVVYRRADQTIESDPTDSRTFVPDDPTPPAEWCSPAIGRHAHRERDDVASGYSIQESRRLHGNESITAFMAQRNS